MTLSALIVAEAPGLFAMDPIAPPNQIDAMADGEVEMSVMPARFACV